MPKVADIAMWRNTVIMATDIVATTEILATDIAATDIAATMVILMEVTTEGTTIPITGPITGAIIMDTHMAATTAGIIEGSGLASIKDGRRSQAEARGSGGASNYVASASELHTNVALTYIQRR